ncbi:hypothetical protein L2E82_49881 [Cichorium intybus]|uniref:Uncharacterized protein n=1 Tax=Cichorium intybus TaxID=13427 RepID=A0ACB8Z2D4_CICIN|nr:hypothetical protein L2E82_49881 [Cichorium intybus]
MVSGEGIGLIMYQEGGIEEVARYDDTMRSGFIVDEVYLGATIDRRLLTIDCEKVGRESHIDEKVNRFREGSFVLQRGAGKTPTIIYGTESGALGMIVSLPKVQFTFMELLQTSIRKVVNGIGGFTHKQWRNNTQKDIKSEGFVDGDLVKSFIDLDDNEIREISEMMGFLVEELRNGVEDLKRLY